MVKGKDEPKVLVVITPPKQVLVSIWMSDMFIVLVNLNLTAFLF
jgi:hypothetical protein